MIYNIRHAIHPNDFKLLQTNQIRDAFLLPELFTSDQMNLCYTHYDRLIIGGVQPVKSSVALKTFEPLKADFFLQRREIGIVNVGGKGTITVDGKDFTLLNKEALYVGRGNKELTFHPGESPQYYFNSAPAHVAYQTKKISADDAEVTEIGSQDTSNHRTIRKLIVSSIVDTCQLQMGLTEIKKGSVWNTMPPHIHDRRMEVYFYFDLPDEQVVCHFIGEPLETRHIFVKNNEAVISPPWSIHSGAGTSSYSFIWGMAGENLDYTDMDPVNRVDLR